VVDPFVVIMTVLVGGLLVILILLGVFYPGSGADQVNWRPTRSVETEVQNELDDMEQMLEAQNERRRRKGLPDRTMRDVEVGIRDFEREQAARRDAAMAGLGPADVDVLQLYDAFTITPILFLEDLGFCAKGEGGPFVSGGRIAPGGELPVNTNGGGLSYQHPGMYGLLAIVEAARQLRGASTGQIDDCHVALAHGNGGVLSAQCTVLLGDETTL